MRLIDADALMRSIEPILEAEEQIYGCSSWCFAIKCRDEVQDAPTVDAVPVRRCKDCKHYQFADNRAFGFPVKRCEWTGFEDVDDEDFCSRGERKDGERA